MNIHRAMTCDYDIVNLKQVEIDYALKTFKAKSNNY